MLIPNCLLKIKHCCTVMTWLNVTIIFIISVRIIKGWGMWGGGGLM